jgi:hypothetical protein
MSKIYTDIFDQNRMKIWEQLRVFSDLGKLGGGTALALQINHRVSYDFDIFTENPVEKALLRKVTAEFPNRNVKPLIDNTDELTVEVGDVKLTFLFYPFKGIATPVSTKSLSLFGVEDLAADKAYTVGRRGAWRDYYDIYSILNKGIMSLENITSFAKQKFGSLFSEKLFLEQLTYYNDITDFSIETIQGTAVDFIKVQSMLKSFVKIYLSETLKG